MVAGRMPLDRLLLGAGREQVGPRPQPDRAAQRKASRGGSGSGNACYCWASAMITRLKAALKDP
jgi:hypothetical protein